MAQGTGYHALPCHTYNFISWSWRGLAPSKNSRDKNVHCSFYRAWERDGSPPPHPSRLWAALLWKVVWILTMSRNIGTY